MIPARNYIVISTLGDKEISPCWLLEKLGSKADRGGICLFELLNFFSEILEEKPGLFISFFSPPGDGKPGKVPLLFRALLIPQDQAGDEESSITRNF